MMDDDDVFGFAVFLGTKSFTSDLSKWSTERVTDMMGSKLSFLFALYKRISLTCDDVLVLQCFGMPSLSIQMSRSGILRV